MSEGSQEVTMSRWELEKEREHAVISAKLEQLDSVIPEVFSSIKTLDEKVTKIPIEIIQCRESMDKTQKEYMHKEFVTNGELQQFESKLEKKFGMEFGKVNRKIGRASWMVSGFIAASVTIFYLLIHTNITVQ